MIFGARPDQRCKAFDGFQVVIEDVGTGIHDGPKRVFLGMKVGDEDFDDDIGIFLADGEDGPGKVIGSPVLQVVARDGGDDDVIELHPGGSFGNSLGFIGFEGEGFGGFDGTESAGTGATISRDHEGGRSLPPAFPAVGALGFFADGVKVEIGDDAFGGPEYGVAGQAHFDPGRFAFLVEGWVDFAGRHFGER